MNSQARNTLLITGVIAAGIMGVYFFLGEPRARNFSKYTEYQATELKLFKDTYGEDPKSWSEATLAQYTRMTKEFMCLDRYMSENHPFAEGVTSCKYESSLP